MESKMLKSFVKTLSVTLLLLFSIIFTGCAIEPKKTVPVEYQVGQTTFHKVCAQCHGADAMGGGKEPQHFCKKSLIQKTFLMEGW